MYVEYNKLVTLAAGFLIFFLLLFVYTRLAGPIPFAINSINTNRTDLFESSGIGKAAAAPDKAKISVGVTESAPQVLDAQERTNQKSKAIIDAIKSLGVEEKDIRTTNYSVSPDYSFGPTTQRITGYTVTQNIDVTTNIDKINQVVDAATAAGANIAGGIQFILSDEKLEEVENQAREEAVKVAKRKAEGLAKAAGLRLGRIVDVNESPTAQPPQPLFAERAADLGVPPEEPTQITPGENNVEVTVTLVYQTL